MEPINMQDKNTPLLQKNNMNEDDLISLENKQVQKKSKSTDPTPFFVSLFQNLVSKDDGGKFNKQMATAAMVFALAFLPLQNADAAMSGGRMGGSFSSAPRQTTTRMAPSSSFSRGYSRGYSSGYMSRPSVTIAPSIGYGYGYSPFISPFGFGNPYVYGGPGVISYSRGPSFFSLLVLGGFLFAVTSALRNSSSMIDSPFSGGSSSNALFEEASALGPGTSVVQLSVAMDVPNRFDRNSILGALDRISQSAKTDSRVGVQNLTSQVALELLRRRSSIVSASSSYKHFNNRNQAQREFQSKSIKERSKFETETVSRYGGVDYSARIPALAGGGDSLNAAGGSKATMAVVTLVLAIDGDSTKVPTINSITDVENALRRIASDSKVDDCLQSAEILWTPQDAGETLSLRDVVADYPELRSV